MAKIEKIPPQHQREQPGLEYKMKPQPEVIGNYKPAGKLLGKKVFITGGDSGIGKAVALLFAMEGADVAISYFNETEDAIDTRDQLEKLGSKYLLFPGDIKDEEHCKQIIDEAAEEFGGLNILVNNAAVQYPQESIEEIKTEELIETFETNIFAMFYLTKAALKYMKKGDSIINTTSVTAYRGSDHLIDYSSTKGAIVSFTRSLSASLAKKNIRVNAVAPGPIWTPLIPSTFSADEVKRFGQDSPLGRPGQPSEVAPAFVFLASEDSSYITGQVLHPNGGEIING